MGILHLLEEVEEASRTVMVVGHEPTMSILAHTASAHASGPNA